MLSRADAALVARDPVIRGLRVVLDGEAFIEALRHALPGLTAESAQAYYLRYKPGAACLVGYQLREGAATQRVYARAFAPELRDKLARARQLQAQAGPLGVGGIVLDAWDIAVYVWPHDPRLKALGLLVEEQARAALLRQILPDHPALWGAALHELRYKPERRFVGRLLSADGTSALIKCFSADEYEAVRSTGRLAASEAPRLARPLGRSGRHRLRVSEWLPGVALGELLDEPQAAAAALHSVGLALAALHAQSPAKLRRHDAADEARALEASARMIGTLGPELAARAHALATGLAHELAAGPPAARPIHGDFYADQVLIDAGAAALIDLDNAVLGDPCADMGSFAAHLYTRGCDEPRVSRALDALLGGYGRGLSRRTIDLYTAAGLLRRAPEAFRYRADNWPATLATALARAEEITAYDTVAS